MDRLRRFGKAKKNDQGDQHVRQEKSKLKLPSSNLVARLMRFDGLKSQQRIHRQHKSLVEQNLQRTSPVALVGDSHLLDVESHGKRLTEHPEYKDIYEDKFENSRVNISGSRRSRGHMNDKTKDEDFDETIVFVNGVNVSASQLREAKKQAKKVIIESTHTMKETEAKEAARRFNKEVHEVFSRMRTDFPSFVKEIPGTGGLHDFSGIDTASESKVMKMTSYDSTESFTSRQAKKRLLERWRRAQRNEHARAGGKGSTLGEMLCISEEKLKILDGANTRRDSPLGISSADGWKDKYSKIKPRSRSLPPPGTRNGKLYVEHKYRTDDKLLTSKEAGYQCQRDRVHVDFTENEDLSSRTSRSSKRRSQSRHRRASDSNACLEKHISHYEIDTAINDSSEYPMVPPTPTVTIPIGTVESTAIEYLTASFVSPDAFYPDISGSMLKRSDSYRGGQEHSNPKHLGSVAESSGTSKEADPNSSFFLEVPSREDVSSGPECFKQVIADLHDLRKQLSLLSRESKTNFDAPMHIKTDFADEGSDLAVDANEIVVSGCWESFYIADVLIECGLYNMDTNIFMQISNGANLPLGPWVFHNLENKYSDEVSAPKYERMMLFDRIRFAVLEISQSCMSPWVKPVTAELGLKWPKCELRNEVHKLLAIQDEEVEEVISRKVIDKVTYWGDLRNSVDMIGIKIERSLTNDLLMELVMELQFDV